MLFAFVEEVTKPENLVKSIGVLAFVWYYASILYIGFVARPVAGSPPDTLREFMSVSVTTLSTTLATFVGMAFGFQQVTAKAEAGPDVAAAATVVKLVPLTPWQTAAVQWYLGSLVLTLLFWAWKRNDCDPVLQNTARSLLGLLGGALAVVLSVRT